MEALFENSPIFVFFFAMIAIFNYTDLKIEQRLSIMYISIYALVATKAIGLKMAIFFLFITMFCYLEIFTNDEMKRKILTNPLYKFIDCLYLSFTQYYLFFIILSVGCLYFRFDKWLGQNVIWLKVLSVFFFMVGIIKLLRQKYIINTFDDMYKIFEDYPINKVNFSNERFQDACLILTSIEDKYYFTRKSYTFLSISHIYNVAKNKIEQYDIFYAIKKAPTFVNNIISYKRGYSTIPMQLIRSLGVTKGYNCTIRRKIFELLYSRMFFEGVKRLLKDECVTKREHYNEYLLYLYFHIVNTFLGNATFSKFLNAFDMQFSKKNQKDIYECSKEGIFIACMGLSKRATKINENTIDYYLSNIPTELNKNEILIMVSKMMSKPYNNNFLK